MTLDRLMFIIFILLSIMAISRSPMLSMAKMIYRTRSFNKRTNEFISTVELIEQNGYVAEVHELFTEDGYQIILHRMPGKKVSDEKTSRNFSKPVAFLQHGTGASSSIWLMTGETSLPIMLADHGYDVWLGNTRGNSYSTGHTILDNSRQSYWNFSLHEQGIYDLPSSIDYTLTISNQKSLILIGHSKAIATAYILLSLKPRYNERIRLLVAYAPVLYISHTRSRLIQSVIKNLNVPSAKQAVEIFHFYSMPDMKRIHPYLIDLLCGVKIGMSSACLWGIHLTGGFDVLMNQSVQSSLFRHFPAGGSIKELMHYLQIGRTGKFSEFNEDSSKGNYVEYPISSIEVPVVVFWGANDFLSNKRDADLFIRQTKNIVGVYKVPHPQFAHGDFVWGSSSDFLLYNKTLDLMKRF